MDSLLERHIDTQRGMHYRYHVSTTGDAAKPALLLLQGWPDSALFWKSTIPRLAKLNVKLIVPDLLGYGGSCRPSDVAAYDHRLMSYEMIEILNAETIEKVIPVGHDFGCWFTFKFQALYTERCVAAVHVGIAYMPPMTEMPDLDTLNDMMEKTVGFRRYNYFHLFTSDDAPELFLRHLDGV